MFRKVRLYLNQILINQMIIMAAIMNKVDEQHSKSIMDACAMSNMIIRGERE